MKTLSNVLFLASEADAVRGPQPCRLPASSPESKSQYHGPHLHFICLPALQSLQGERGHAFLDPLRASPPTTASEVSHPNSNPKLLPGAQKLLGAIMIQDTSKINLVPIMGHSNLTCHSSITAKRRRAREKALEAFLNTVSPVSTLQSCKNSSKSRILIIVEIFGAHALYLCLVLWLMALYSQCNNSFHVTMNWIKGC